jgi:hypothetical protein
MRMEISRRAGHLQPFTRAAAPGTASGFTRDPFPNSTDPRELFDSVASRVIQAYPLPETRIW